MTIYRAAELRRRGVSSGRLRALLASGKLYRVERGSYSDTPVSAHVRLRAAQMRRRGLVFTGETALFLYGVRPCPERLTARIPRGHRYRDSATLTLRESRVRRHRVVNGVRVVTPVEAVADFPAALPWMRELLTRGYAGTRGRQVLAEDLAALPRAVPSWLRSLLQELPIGAASHHERRLYLALLERFRELAEVDTGTRRPGATNTRRATPARTRHASPTAARNLGPAVPPLVLNARVADWIVDIMVGEDLAVEIDSFRFHGDAGRFTIPSLEGWETPSPAGGPFIPDATNPAPAGPIVPGSTSRGPRRGGEQGAMGSPVHLDLARAELNARERTFLLDRCKANYLQRRGLTVLRYTTDTVDYHLREVVDEIVDTLARRRMGALQTGASLSGASQSGGSRSGAAQPTPLTLVTDQGPWRWHCALTTTL
ncbi:type IV toxin-antitoxin system AbiEi family antitoxin domain-containing protein [Corynebacterium heidelbergense]|uniref:DUF559 domain-containing protein n=1 Tax=Corynebacterium heidelbergense TaxID=2055947 RepID=A0A364VBW3_9CORY|nr:type IV toxin-antitoxin system AbiEi family antitoxin domain-containing protein [Corynebacterium heidelbergense]RAV34143.1 hypothetical protein CWC39_04865 [Corynebacterium heidelbergense]WCZ36090.1 hypothetical protein CHEID_02625 [Corynebacterium heidelbergense]